MSVLIGKRALEALTKHVTEEFIAAYGYLSMECVLTDMGLNGSANWCMKKYESHRQTALKLIQHLETRGAKFKLSAIPALRQDWRSPLHIFEEAQRLEQKLSGLLAIVYESSLADKDFISIQFIQTFLNEQCQSESEVMLLLNRLRKMQSTDLGIFQFDNELIDKK